MAIFVRWMTDFSPVSRFSLLGEGFILNTDILATSLINAFSLTGGLHFSHTLSIFRWWVKQCSCEMFKACLLEWRGLILNLHNSFQIVLVTCALCCVGLSHKFSKVCGCNQKQNFQVISWLLLDTSLLTAGAFLDHFLNSQLTCDPGVSDQQRWQRWFPVKGWEISNQEKPLKTF